MKCIVRSKGLLVLEEDIQIIYEVNHVVSVQIADKTEGKK